MPAWNHWYHLVANTYGTWLPGDPRGFRTREHREHVEGDYKSPPAADYAWRHEHSRQQMKREPVWLSVEARDAAVEAIRVALVDVHRLQVLAIAVCSAHLHVLARFPAELKRTPTDSIRGLRSSALDDPPRHFLGIAKKESAKTLAALGFVPAGGVWARRGKIVPITDRTHQVRVYHYVLDHRREGAAAWSFRPKPTD
ncbi:MAG: hypothetical protein ACOC1G_01180 [Phycisphaeraceae bacterium]